MVLTILAIPLLILGVLISPYSLEATRCFAIGFASKGGYCFEQGSSIPNWSNTAACCSVLRCSMPAGCKSSGGAGWNRFRHARPCAGHPRLAIDCRS
jgi:hypothetical protein